MNQYLLQSYLDFVFLVVDLDSVGKLMIWDSCRVHIAKSIKAYMAQRGIVPAVIPGGLTPYLQAGDIGIFKRFKDKISPLIEAWKNSNEF